MYYSYAKLSQYDAGFIRFIGGGLGNLLFPWSRFILATHQYNLTSIAPTWGTIKIGPLLRGDFDKRFYFGLFRKLPNEIGGLRKLHLLYTLPRISEHDLTTVLAKKQHSSDKLIIFEDVHPMFIDILKEHDFITHALIDLTLEEHRRRALQVPRSDISIHVRLTDFKLNKQGTPLSWYTNQVTKLRRELNRNLSVNVFSDGRDDELITILNLPNVYLVSCGTAISDLLALSGSKILIASGKSTFSMWASYLGRMPVIWPKGGLWQRLYYNMPEGEIECAEADDLPSSFISLCRMRLSSNPG
jgi:hypothetical protein